MSGGVDSSVSAALLLEQGYEVVGAFMKNWSGDVNGPECKSSDRVGDAYEECGWKQERRDAARVAAKLGIPFVTLDFEKEYRRDVVEYLFSEYQAGRTPNPDVMCNKFIKFDRFVRAADELGCDVIATGHYAQIKNGQLSKAVDQNKDQTYFLWAMNKEVLPRTLFPVGHLTKPEVREKAREFGLDVADKKDSTGICFVGEVNMDEFLRARIVPKPGAVVTTDGRRVGTHEGINYYTIGQRHGLGIGGGTPYYVVEKQPQTNELIVSSHYHPKLYTTELTASQLNFFDDHLLTTFRRGEKLSTIRCQARIRHRQPLQDCTVTIEHQKAIVVFDRSQRAATPGQSIVFYQGETVLGGGIIDETSFEEKTDEVQA